MLGGTALLGLAYTRSRNSTSAAGSALVGPRKRSEGGTELDATDGRVHRGLPLARAAPVRSEPSAAKTETPGPVSLDEEEYHDASDSPVEEEFLDAEAPGDFLREVRKMRTRDVLDLGTDDALRFCARSRVHDLCDLASGGDLVATRVLTGLCDDGYGRAAKCTAAQVAFLRGVINGGKKHKRVENVVFFGRLLDELGKDLVHKEYGHVEVWDVRECTTMRGAFRNSRIKGRLDLRFWDTRNVTDMGSAFESTAFDADVSTWDVSKARDMGKMFHEASRFQGDVSEWDVSKVRNMSAMFWDAGVFNGDVSNWDVGRVEDMSSMFSGAKAFNQDLGMWNVSKVTTMADMFLNAERFNGDVDRWVVSGVFVMRAMFRGASQFDRDLGLWDVGNVTDMGEMFRGASSFTGGGLERWKLGDCVVKNIFQGAANVRQEALDWLKWIERNSAGYGRVRRARRGFV